MCRTGILCCGEVCLMISGQKSPLVIKTKETFTYSPLAAAIFCGSAVAEIMNQRRNTQKFRKNFSEQIKHSTGNYNRHVVAFFIP